MTLQVSPQGNVIVFAFKERSCEISWERLSGTAVDLQRRFGLRLPQICPTDRALELTQVVLYHFGSPCIPNRSALVITDTEDKLIARAASSGLKSHPVTGYKTPAAMGMPRAL